ncbi:MAG: hypothetical protein BWY60_00505 [Actinobacteria bacterium ADurb.Bin346]|nr:MAG: hypothetical protein BWY60_00505 [Actinobacteria bacterium ADurb.Bin346]
MLTADASSHFLMNCSLRISATCIGLFLRTGASTIAAFVLRSPKFLFFGSPRLIDCKLTLMTLLLLSAPAPPAEATS